MHLRTLVAALSSAGLLVACGGGGSTPPAASSPPPAAPASTTLTGTAATGAALASAAISVKCSAGTATTTSATDGTYTVTLTDAALPCVVTATSSDGLTELHSVVPGTGAAGTAQTANVTPLTELLVAQLTGQDPKAFVASFTTSTPIPSADVQTAATALLAKLTTAGVDTTAAANILSGSISAGTGTGYDGVLDALKTTLTTAGTTLADLTTTVASTKDTSTTSTSSITTLLAPVATDCAGLKSGKLRVIDFDVGSNEVVTVDAVGKTVTDSTGAVFTLSPTPGATGSCDYTINNAYSTRVLVSRSGAAFLMSGSGLSGSVGFAIPEQALDVATVAGTYNRVQYGQTFDSFTGDFGTTVFAADGTNGISFNCAQGYSSSVACVEDSSPKGKLVANAAGGFDYVEQGVSQARVFGFRTPSGRTLMVGQQPDGTVVMLASADNLTPNAVGTKNAFRQFQVNPTNGLTAVTEDEVTTSDVTGSLVTRTFTSDGHTDKVTVNMPYTGMRYRAPASCLTSGGTAYASCAPVVQVPIAGFTVSVSAAPQARRFVTVSVDKN